jgi:flagellar hook-associated protein 3 FlgL
MDISRISTYNTHQGTLGDAVSVQAELFRLQGQISSGLKADTFQDLNGQVESFTALDNRLRRTDLFIQQNQLTDNRLKTMSNVLDQVVDIANDTKNLLVLARNDATGDSLAFNERLEGLWGAFVGQMNTNADGRYLFSGTRTDTAPVDTDFPILEESGTADDGYYRGNKENMQFRVQDDYEFAQTVRADDPAFQSIAAAFSMAKDAYNSGDDVKMGQAFDFIQTGISSVLDLQATLNTQSINVNNATERLQTLKLYWKGVREDMINTDLVSASTQVAINQSILQASFQAFARINQLKLSDYLR